MRRRVASTLGWWMECIDWKTTSRIFVGSIGWKTPVEPSPIPPMAWETICRLSEVCMPATSIGRTAVFGLSLKNQQAARIGDGSQNMVWLGRNFLLYVEM
jgi:hypothetical protein